MSTSDIQVVFCSRCGLPCKLANHATEEARLLKHATSPETSGYCPDCAIADFMKNHSPLGYLMEQNPAGKEMLLDSRVQARFARLLQAGNADAKPTEINWQVVYDNWDLPFVTPHKKRGKKA